MALSDKDIRITPNTGQSADPKIDFKGADASTGPQTITLKVYPTDGGTLSFEGSAGQLFSISNSLQGSLYSVNDASGIPSIEVMETGAVKLAEFNGLVGIGTSDFSYAVSDATPLVSSNTNNKLFVNGSIQLTGSNDALVIGRSTSTFLKDEELGFGWGSGWYQTDGSFLRVRNNTSVYSTGDARFSAYYDSNDANYYLNPTSTTSLRTVGSWRSDSSTWDGEFAGKMQYHSDSWYLQYTNNLYLRNASGTNVWNASSAGVTEQSGGATIAGTVFIRTASPTLYLRDTDHRTAAVHVNSNEFYILRGDGTDTASWAQYDSYWPLTISLSSNAATFGGQILKRGINVPALHIQDTAPTPYNDGDLWWESDTGKLKIRYNDGSSSQWVDASPIPDVSTFYSKAGGAITGAVTVNSTIQATGNITSDTNMYVGANVVWNAGNDGTGSGLDADLLDGNHASAFAVSGHNHTYDVNNAWLRDASDDANVKLYGNSRQMAFRTDGTTEYASGVGGYPFAWMYGGDAAANRVMLVNTDGDLWTSTNGWLSTALSGKASTSQTMFIGTTSVAINRASANLALTGITSITGGTGTTAISFNSANTTSAASGAVTISSGTTTTSGLTGALNLNTGSGAAGSGAISIASGAANTIGSSGDITIVTGLTAAANTGGVTINTGSAAANYNSGSLLISTGNTAGTGVSGDITISSGDGGGSGAGGASSINIYAGDTASTVAAGAVNLVGGNSTSSTTSATGGLVSIRGGSTSSSAAIAKTTGSVYIDGGGTGAGGTVTYGSVYIGYGVNGASQGTTHVTIGKSGTEVRLPGVGTSGFVKLGANGALSQDTNTYALTNQTMFIGTTSVAINRTSANLALTGVSIDGSAGSAATLTTARNINGTSFNGSANITTASWGTSRTITIGGTGKAVDGSTTVTWTVAEVLPTSTNLQINSLGIGTAASATTGEIRATNDITAFYTSDIKFKENIRPIDSALDKVCAIGGKYFDWKDNYIKSRGGEDGYFVRKQDFGVIAQDVMKVFPLGVRTKEDETLAVDYEKLCALAFEAIKELRAEVENLKRGV